MFFSLEMWSACKRNYIHYDVCMYILYAVVACLWFVSVIKAEVHIVCNRFHSSLFLCCLFTYCCQFLTFNMLFFYRNNRFSCKRKARTFFSLHSVCYGKYAKGNTFVAVVACLWFTSVILRYFYNTFCSFVLYVIGAKWIMLSYFLMKWACKIIRKPV